MKYNTLSILLIFTILSITNVMAVPPLTTEFVGNEGLDIQANIFDYYKTNTSAELHIHVFNISNGAMLSNLSVTCDVELTDSQGTVLLSGNPIPHEDHFKMIRNASVVTEVGIYGVIIVCNSSEVTGSKTAFFEATPEGNPPPEGIVIIAFSILLLLILSVSVTYMLKAIGHIVEMNFDLMDIGIMWGMYFALLGVNQLAMLFLGNVVVNDWLDLFVKIYAFPMMIVPVIAFFLSIFNMQKKNKEKARQW